MAVNLEKLRAMLDDVVWADDERLAIDEVLAELRAARENAKPTAQKLFGQVAALEADIGLHFTVATPPSSKNARRARVLPDGRVIQFRPREIVQATEAIQAAAVDALKRQAPRCFAERLPLLIDEDARVEIVHNVHNDTADVLVRRAGPRPKGTTGRRRDVHNIPELVCDAIQRIAYSNDNQVADLRVWRNIGVPTTRP